MVTDPRADVVSDEQLARSIDRMEREAEYCRADARLGLEAGDPEPYERIAAALRELQRLSADRTPAPAQPMTGAPGTSTPAQREAFIARGNVMAPAQPDAAAGDVAKLLRHMWDAGWQARAAAGEMVGDSIDHWSPAWKAVRDESIQESLARVSPAPQTVPKEPQP